MANKFKYLIYLILVVFVTACSKESINSNVLSDKEDKPLADSSKINIYFRGTINGVYKNWTVTNYKNTDNLPYRYNTASGVDTLGSNCTETFCKYMIEDATIFQNPYGGSMKNYIAAGFNISSKTGDRNEIISQFMPGQKTFGKPRRTINDPVKDGVYVYYIDENGKDWCSHNSPGIQANSLFVIEDFATQPYSDLYTMNTWRAKFTCILYDRNGNSIQVTNAEISSPIIVKL